MIISPSNYVKISLKSSNDFILKMQANAIELTQTEKTTENSCR
jgi:hypothetical protein